MDPEAAAYIASIQPSDEDLQFIIDEVREWQSGPLPMRAFGYCAIAWPRVREFALKDWGAQLADPESPAIDSALPTIGWYLAAANRDKAFLKPLLEGWSRDLETVDLLFGDVLLEDGPCFMALMASESEDHISLLEEAALPKQDINPVINQIPLEALALLVADGVLPRERFDELVHRYIQNLSSSDFVEDASARRGWLTSIVCDLGVGPFVEEIRSWFEKGLLPTGFMALIDRKGFEESVARGLTTPDPEWRNRERYPLIREDSYEAMRWLMHEDEEADNHASKLYDFQQEPYIDPDEVTMPLYRTEPKIGRNDPCPCDSGKKYKKCCGKAG